MDPPPPPLDEAFDELDNLLAPDFCLDGTEIPAKEPEDDDDEDDGVGEGDLRDDGFPKVKEV